MTFRPDANSQDDVSDRILGLQTGADDYLTNLLTFMNYLNVSSNSAASKPRKVSPERR